jgi:copper transport protein
MLLIAAGLWAGTGAASAHAVLISTTPARDSVLPTLPGQVSLTFGETVVLPPNALRIFAPDGVEVDDGHPTHPGGGAATVGIGVRPGSAQGSYTVAWRVISADTHPVSGAFIFSVGHLSATAAATTAPAGGSAVVGVLYAVVRALAYAGFALMVGAAALLLFCWPAGAARHTGPRVAATGWATLLLATVATLLLQGPYGDGTGLADVFEPGAVSTTLQLPLGGALAARLLLLAGTAVYLGQLNHRLPVASSRARRVLAAAGAVLAAATASTWSVSGHAAVGLQPQIAFPADIAHLLAMGVWLGGLAALAMALRRTPADAEEPGELARAVTRFSTIAFGCVVVLVGTGTYQSWRQLGTWSAFLDTDYGRLLGVKILLVGALVATAAVSRAAVARMRRQATGHRPVPAAVAGPTHPVSTLAPPAPPGTLAPDPVLRRTVLIEAGIAATVLALTAILVNAEPGRTAEAAEAAAAAGPVQAHLSFDTDGANGTGSLDIRVDPARTGPNTLLVTVRTPNGVVRDIPELRAELTLPERHLGPLAVPVDRQGPGRYQGTEQIPIAGDWQLALTVRTSDIDETTVRLPLTVH